MKYKCCSKITESEIENLEGIMVPDDAPLEFYEDDHNYSILIKPIKHLNSGGIIYQEYTSKQYILHHPNPEEIQ